MELLKSHFFLIKKAYIESFIILLFLSCCPFIVSSCHEEEKEEIPESPFDEEDIQHEQDLNAYLGKSMSADAGEDVEKEEHSSIAGGIVSWYNLSGNQFGSSSENWT